MRRAFADAFFFIALLNPRDAYHEAAIALAGAWHGQMLTSRWVLAEVANALSGIRSRGSFITFLKGLSNHKNLIVLDDSDGLFDEGRVVYEARPDKEWSLTDCISFAAMHKLALDEAITGDHHFEQAGFRILLKAAS